MNHVRRWLATIRLAEALGTVFPVTTLQTCIVHLIRNSLDYAIWKDRMLLTAAIKPIYTATSAEAAQAELDAQAWAMGPEVPHSRGCMAPRLGSRAKKSKPSMRGASQCIAPALRPALLVC